MDVETTIFVRFVIEMLFGSKSEAKKRYFFSKTFRLNFAPNETVRYAFKLCGAEKASRPASVNVNCDGGLPTVYFPALDSGWSTPKDGLSLARKEGWEVEEREMQLPQ